MRRILHWSILVVSLLIVCSVPIFLGHTTHPVTDCDDDGKRNGVGMLGSNSANVKNASLASSVLQPAKLRHARRLLTSCSAGRYFDGSSCIRCDRGSYGIGGTASCEPCLAGKYSGWLGATACRLCNAGKFSTTDWASTCKNCPEGTSTSTEGAMTEGDCLPCRAGKYAGTGYSACQTCPAGSFSNAVSATSSAACSACPAGKFSALPGANSSSHCAICQDGKTSRSYATACYNCYAGTYSNATFSFCVGCDAGKFSPSGSSSCTECEAGKWSSTQSSSCRTCLSGKYAAALASSCTSCPAGKYLATAGGFSEDSCLNCSAGTSSLEGSSSCFQCPRGKYSTCPASCELCPAGKYSATEGSTSPDVCMDCAAGKFSLEGFSECRSCDSGKHSSQSASVCDRCVPGKFSNTYEATSSATCQDCSAGKHANSAGSSWCSSCQSGKYSSQSASVCDLCTPGKFSNTYEATSSATCQDCSAGKYANSAGSSWCSSCQGGKYSKTESASSCISCDAGKYSTASPATSSDSCAYCEADKGQYSTAGSTRCSTCGQGEFLSTASSCGQCAPGKHSDATGAISRNTCVDCEGGKYSEAGWATCLVCPPGTFSAASGLRTCSSCDAGKYSPLEGQSSCLPCPAGYYSQAAASQCLLCAAGKSSNAGASFCTLCPAGQSSLHKGTVSAGSVITVGSRVILSKWFQRESMAIIRCDHGNDNTDCHCSPQQEHPQSRTYGRIWSGTATRSEYKNNAQCSWIIAADRIDSSASIVRSITLRFSSFDLKDRGDKVRIYECTSSACTKSSNTLIATLDHYDDTEDVQNGKGLLSKTGYMKVEFTSDSEGTSSGFRATWSTVNVPGPLLYGDVGVVVRIISRSHTCQPYTNAACRIGDRVQRGGPDWNSKWESDYERNAGNISGTTGSGECHVVWDDYDSGSYRYSDGTYRVGKDEAYDLCWSSAQVGYGTNQARRGLTSAPVVAFISVASELCTLTHGDAYHTPGLLARPVLALLLLSSLPAAGLSHNESSILPFEHRADNQSHYLIKVKVDNKTWWYHESVVSLITCDECMLIETHRTDMPQSCGDGYKSESEACDDGNNLDGDGCRADCSAEESLYSCSSSGCGLSTCMSECAAGKYVDSQSQPPRCQDCEAGTYSDHSSPVCVSCPAGTYSKSAASICIPCEAGKASRPSSISCISCSDGNYSAQLRFAKGVRVSVGARVVLGDGFESLPGALQPGDVGVVIEIADVITQNTTLAQPSQAGRLVQGVSLLALMSIVTNLCTTSHSYAHAGLTFVAISLLPAVGLAQQGRSEARSLSTSGLVECKVQAPNGELSWYKEDALSVVCGPPGAQTVNLTVTDQPISPPLVISPDNYTHQVYFAVSLPYASDDEPAAFDLDKQGRYRKAIANAGRVHIDHVNITKMEVQFRRSRLRVETTVKASDQEMADEISARLTEKEINAELVKTGLPECTFLEAPETIVIDSNLDPKHLTLYITVPITAAALILCGGCWWWRWRDSDDDPPRPDPAPFADVTFRLRPDTFYHATSPENALKIQEYGFVIPPGPGGMLGRGVYCSSTLQKAMDYANGKPHGGVVLELKIDLGRCKELEVNDPMMKTWQENGYDSAWCPFSAVDPADRGKEENCIKDPARITVVRTFAADTSRIKQGGYHIVNDKLRKIRQ